MRTKWMVCGVVAALLALTACGTSTPGKTGSTGSKHPGYLAVADTSGTSAGGTLHLEVASDVVEASGLDPQAATLAASWSILALSYQTLVTIGPDYTIEPMLATSWDHPNATTYIFHLRSGVKFSNGRTMTAADVVGSLQRVANGKTVWRTQVGPIKTVREVNDSTVEVDLSQPYTPFLAAIAHVDAAIMPMKALDAKAFDPTKQMLGTGPYEVVSHRQDVSWTFARNPYYWQKGEPSFDKLDVKIVTSDATRAADLRSGAADAVELSSNDDPANLAGAPNVKVVTQSTPNFYYLILNSQRPGSKLADQRVREALNIALNRKQLVDVAMSGLGSPTGIVPAGLPGACNVSQLPSASKSIADAKQLLSDAGASKLSFALTIFNEDPQEAQIAQVLQQQLQQLGITVKINAIDPGSFTKAFNASPSGFDAALSYFAGYADPGMVIRWWNPKLAVFSASFKADDPTMDTLIEQVQSQSGSERTASIKSLCDRADHDAEMIPLVTAPSIIGYRSDVLSPTIYADEGYGEPWRDIAAYRRIGK